MRDRTASSRFSKKQKAKTEILSHCPPKNKNALIHHIAQLSNSHRPKEVNTHAVPPPSSETVKPYRRPDETMVRFFFGSACVCRAKRDDYDAVPLQSLIGAKDYKLKVWENRFMVTFVTEKKCGELHNWKGFLGSILIWNYSDDSLY